MLTGDVLQKIGHLIDKCLEVTEQRITDQLRTEFTNQLESTLAVALAASEKRIIKQMGEFINDSILPQLDDKSNKDEIDKLSQKVKKTQFLPTVAERKSQRVLVRLASLGD